MMICSGANLLNHSIFFEFAKGRSFLYKFQIPGRRNGQELHEISKRNICRQFYCCMDGIRKNTIFKPSGAAAKLFVYGTLRKAYGHKLYNILKDQFEFIAKGSIRGILFDIGKYPGAVISKRAKTEIVGEIYRVRDYHTTDSALKILDEYEGYDGSDLLGSEYIRKKKFVKLHNGKKLLCWVYIYNRPVINKHPIRSGDYIQGIPAKDSP